MTVCDWTLLDEPWDALGGWADGDNGGSVSEIDPAGQLHLDQLSMTSSGRSRRSQDIGTIGAGDYTFYMRFYVDNWDTGSSSPYSGSAGIKLSIEAGTNLLVLAICNNGVAVYDGGGYNQAFAHTFNTGTWYTITGHVHNSQTDIDILIGNVPKSTDTDCSFGASTDGNVNIYGYGNIGGSGIGDSEFHIDYIKINAGICNPTAFLPDNSTFQKLTIDNTEVSGGSNLTDFPVLVADGNILDAAYAAMEGDGDDIRFTTDEAGTTEIPFEIVALDSGAKTCQIWVKRTVVHDTDTDFYIWYGDASLSAYAANATYGSENVWDNNYIAVYHMEESSGDLKDSTSNQNDETFNGDLPTPQVGKVGNSQFFDGTGDTAGILGSARLSGNMTVQTWLRPSEVNTVKYIASDWVGSNRNFVLARESNNKIYAAIGDGGTNQDVPLESTTTILVNTFYFVALKRTGTAQKLFINNAVEDSQTGSYTGGVTTTNRYIGATYNAAVPWHGKFDEMRFSDIERGNDWLVTEYNNQNSPSTFITGSSAIKIIDLSETITITDSLAKLPIKPLPETITLTDAIAKLHTHGRSFLETITITDLIAKKASKVYEETITIVDALAKKASRTFSEVITLTDSVSKVKLSIKDFLETITLTDTLSKITTKVLAEVVTITDTLTKQAQKVFSEVITLTDSITKTKSTIKGFLETITITETLTKTLTYVRNFTETITLTDALAKVHTHIKSFAETITIVDTILKIPRKVFTETITIHDRIRRYINGLLVSIWSKIEKTTTVFTKSAKPTTVFTKIVKPLTDIWTKREKPEA